uniref:protein COFACTOR ASSEMBLY OF COMPLEX C SUBUNIT B CCB3, chloroplastic n=1 Tax=Erigeron canadensis TaxID=72917 RepID=UPI001CB9C654|nr:protein COFACTOR ASSEMBLY OF COMPLEX C SUBUNIT B CCB3, chloroplastic [Erigeron canadensis]
MAVPFSSIHHTKGFSLLLVQQQPLHLPSRLNFLSPRRFICPTKRVPNLRFQKYRASYMLEVTVPSIDIPISSSLNSTELISHVSDAMPDYIQSLVLMDLDPGTAKLAIALLGPFLSAFSFLFIVRIVMSWYPKIPVGKFPYVVAYAPTEPILTVTRKVIPPLGGVDVTPVVWFGLISFLNEILVGPQGLLVLLSQQV